MIMSFVGKDAAVEALKQAVETQGRDFVYNTEGERGMCFYSVAAYRSHRPQEYDATSPKAKTGCLVGVTLDLLGVRYNKSEDRSVTSLEGIKEQVDGIALEILRQAQIKQDEGKSWGYAYDSAMAFAAKLEGRA
jgi:hypothetical protein